jgi:predicted lysophospholipase L1 biosynthesis ABC-type transport system permease subunit
MALGAPRQTVRREIRGRALRAVGLGVAVGVTIAISASPVVEALLYEVDPRDTPTLAIVAALLLVMTAAASELPARRASRVTPASILKE